MSGFFYVVSTPIGNLEDITLRALRTLKEVNLILCEDKRVTIKLLNKYNIKTSLLSFHKFNEAKNSEKVLNLLEEGNNVALVSDAGTPLISDPGQTLITVLRRHNIKIIPIPGPSAITSTLSVCPINCKEFYFQGFLPNEKSERKKTILSLTEKSKAVILFIAPHDLMKYLKEIYDVYSDTEVFYIREITKIHEEHFYGKLKDLINNIENKKIRGEIVLCLDFQFCKKEMKFNDKNTSEILNIMKQRIKSGSSLKETSKHLSEKLNMPSRFLYNLYLKSK